jgi:hypothetical protein
MHQALNELVEKEENGVTKNTMARKKRDSNNIYPPTKILPKY